MFWFCLLLFAQQRWPVQTLSVEGNRLYSSEQILKVAGLKVGQLAGKEEFEAARDRLVATGVFETVGYRFAPGPDRKGYAASFQVVEAGPAYPLRFEGLAVSAAEVMAWLRQRESLMADRAPATQPIMDRYAREIEALLLTKGRSQEIKGAVTAAGPEQFALLFRPAGPEPTVAQVTFTGNQVVPAEALQNAIAGVGIGVPYSAGRFRQILDASVRPLYDARGRIRAAWTNITVAPAKDVQGVQVTVAINEGASYDIGKVDLQGTAPLKPEDLRKAAQIPSGAIANFDVVNQGLERIRDAYRRVGFLKVEAEAVRHIDDSSKKVDLTLRIRPGPQYLMGKLDIRGLDLNGEAAIRKMWGIQQGKPFRADYPDYFLGRVREEGIFDNLKKTGSAVKINDSNLTVDVTLRFN